LVPAKTGPGLCGKIGCVPALFVHGNPETSALWDDLLSHLDRTDVVALSMPGFGCSKPEGFGATKEEYADWLIGELEGLGEPVDLVGHDWGGILAVRAACLRSDLLHSWASDALAFFDEGYEWHPFAKIWQTPGEGEEWVKATLATPLEQQAAAFQSLDMPHDASFKVAGWFDATMGESMLALYRSADGIGAEWVPGLDGIKAPGLRIKATADPFAKPELADRAAQKAGAKTAVLEGLGHWWMLQDPKQGASVIEEFWASLA
jgi:pimeloyl-ACP methyl ester carboxylesterase